MKPFVFYGRAGCLLPFLIIFNLFFGWIFFKPLIWLSAGIILILLFIFNSWVLASRIFDSSPQRRRADAIDAEAEIIDDSKKDDSQDQA